MKKKKSFILVVLVVAVMVMSFSALVHATGGTWTLETQPGPYSWINIVSSADLSHLAMETYSSYIYVSTTSAATWATSTAAGQRTWEGLSSDSTGLKLAADAYSDYVYTSSDGGNTWTQQTTSGLRSWWGITSSADGTHIAAIANVGYIYTSTTTGSTWVQQTAAGSQSWNTIASNASGTQLLAAVNGGSVYVGSTTNNGTSWNWATTTVLGTGSWIDSCSSASGNYLAIANYGGNIYVSSTSGATWATSTGAGTDGWAGLSCSSNGLTIAAIGATVVLSNDGGVTWSNQTNNSNLPGYLGYKGLTMSADGTEMATPYTASGGGVYTYQAYGAPGAPTNLVASTSSPDRAVLTFNAPSNNGGSVILYYVASSTPGGITATSTGSTTSITVEGLNNGTSYTFTVSAVNALGTSTQSGPSNAIIAQANPSSSGQVMFMGTPIGLSGDPSNPITNVFDGSTTSYWDYPSQTGGWVGMDLGSSDLASVLTQWWIMPRPADSNGLYETNTVGAVLQASNDPTFTTGVVTLDTIPSIPYTPRWQYTKRILPATTTAYRAYRLLSSDYGQIAELRFIGNASSSVPARPTPPVISPWGGRFPSGQTTVTIMSSTTSARIYYTTDGTTPSNTNGRLYTGPFTLAIPSQGLTLQAVAYDPNLSTPLSEVPNAAYFEPYGYKPADNWYDDSGILTENHDGGILDNTSRDGTYYWYGSFANVYQQANSYNVPYQPGIWLYSSTDLYNWKNDGEILNSGGQTYVQRPHVLYDSSTNTYVLWAHAENGSSTDIAMVATSSSPTGPWSWENTNLNPDGFGLKDMNLFEDSNGTGYVVYTDGNQQYMYVSQLAPNYLTTTGSYVKVSNTVTNREAPVLFKRNGVYFLITSVGNFYDSTQTYDEMYATSTSPLGTWSPYNTFFASDPVGTIFNAQSSFVLDVDGLQNGWLYDSDQWHANLSTTNALYSSRHVWLPLSFPTNGTLSISTPSVWDLSTFGSISSDVPSIQRGSTGNVVHLTGLLTNWDPGVPDFTVTGGNGADITSETVTDATHATLTLSAGTSAGTITVTDPQSGLTVAIAVQASNSNSTYATAGGGSVSSSELAGLLAPSAAATAYLDSLNGGLTATAITTTSSGVSETSEFTRNLQIGMIGNEVQLLQEYLNASGYPVASSGPGSPGNETKKFGSLTKAALVKFQKAHGIPDTGFFGPITRGFIGDKY